MKQTVALKTKFERAMSQLLLNNTFFGSLVLETRLVENAEVAKRIGVDARGVIYYNPEWIAQLSEKKLMGVLAHEVLHIALLHFIRQGDREAKLWNIATDLAINGWLRSMGFELPEDGCFPEKGQEDWSAEEFYRWLTKNRDKNFNEGWDLHIYIVAGGAGDKSAQDTGGGDNVDGVEKIGSQGSAGSSDEATAQDKNGESKGGNMSGNQKDVKDIDGSNGSGNGEGDKEKNSGNPSDKAGSTAIRLPVSEVERIEKHWLRVVARVVASSRLQGKLPGCLSELVKELFEPKLNWRQILRRFVGDTMVVGDVDWGRRDRRFKDVYLPLHREKMLRMAIAVDTSGSIGTKELGAFFSEINGILNADGKYDIILLQCDARVHDVIHIVYPEKLDMDSVVIKGRGGTDFRPVFEWLKENNEQRPVIYLTDLCGTFPEAFEVRVPVLWVQVGDEKVDVPFGEVVRLEVE